MRILLLCCCFTISCFAAEDAPKLFGGSAAAKVQSYKGKSTKGEFLARIDTNVEFEIPYKVNNSGKIEDVTAKFTVTDDFTADAMLDNKTDTITLTVRWPTKDDILVPAVWKLTFKRNDDIVKLTGSQLSVPVNTSFNFSTNATDHGKIAQVAWLKTLELNEEKKAMYYKCNAVETLNATKGVQTWTDTKIEAFTLNKTTGDFSKEANPCPQDTPTPTPTPATKGNWTVGTCIHVEGDLTLKINYKDKDNKTHDVDVAVPNNAYADPKNGSCDNKFGKFTTEILMLTWKETGDKMNSTMKIVFGDDKNLTGQEKQYAIVQIEVTLDTSNKTQFPNRTEDRFHAKNDLLTNGTGSLQWLGTPEENSYLCKSASSKQIVDVLTIETKNFMAQAYQNTTEFKKSWQCAADRNPKTSDLIPIIVGACLAGLVVIVLVVYLIGRARARRAGGYESV